MSNPYAATSASAYGSQTPNPSSNNSNSNNNTNTFPAGSGSGAVSGIGIGTGNDGRVKYRCADCDTEVVISRGDPIRCVACGHRVLYKLRTTK